MKNDMFIVVTMAGAPYTMSIREAHSDNDLFVDAFEEYCKEDTPNTTSDKLFAWDFFKAGWEAAVRLLNDDKDENV